MMIVAVEDALNKKDSWDTLLLSNYREAPKEAPMEAPKKMQH